MYNVEFCAKVNDFACFRNTFAIHNVKFGGAERWRKFVFHHFHFYVIALQIAFFVFDKLLGFSVAPDVVFGLFEHLHATPHLVMLDAAEFNNMTSDRILGFPDVSKTCMLQSYHQNAEQFEITFNKTKFDALPAKMRAIIENGVEAASQDLVWKAIDRYSTDYIEMQTKDKVKFYKTPTAILQDQLKAYDAAVAKRKDNALFNEIVASQKKFAERVVKWDLDNNVDRRMAYNYYFGKKA